MSFTKPWCTHFINTKVWVFKRLTTVRPPHSQTVPQPRRYSFYIMYFASHTRYDANLPMMVRQRVQCSMQHCHDIVMTLS